MSDIFVKNIEKNKNGGITNVICNSAKLGLIPQRDYFDKDIANSDNTNGYYIIKQNDFVYNPRKSADAPFGPISTYKYSADGIVSPLYLCFRAKESINYLYFEWYFKSNAWHRYVYMSGDSGARHDRVSIRDDVFFSMPINIPSEQEQNHIATFLELLNNRIEKQRQLVEVLKKYKRGLIKKIFKCKEHSITKQSDWKKIKISDCCNGFDNKRKPVASNERTKGCYPYYGANGIQDYVAEYLFDGEYILLAEDGGHFDEFSSKPIAQYISGRSWVNNHAHIIQAKDDYSNKFIFYSLEHKDIRKYINGSSRAKLNQEDMWEIEISVPPIDVQKRIAEVFTAMDKKIKSESNQSINFESFKSGLLQQLFI